MKRSLWKVFCVCAFLLPEMLVAKSAVTKEWTMIVFLNGHNDLDEFSSQNINQMEQVGSTDSLNIVVQWASLKNQETRRLYIQKDEKPDEVTSPVVQTMDPVDMGNVRNLESFLSWAHENYPAKHYFVDIWNHGTGWHRRGLKPLFRDISEDELHDTKIRTETLGLALNRFAKKIGRPIDILGMDACLMAMVEVANEVKGAADVMVGSQDLEPGEGWPYSTFLSHWAENSAMDKEQIAATLVRDYNEAYKDETDRITLSAVRLEKLEALNSAMGELVTHLSELPDAIWIEATNAMHSALRFDWKDYADIGDIVRKLRTTSDRTGQAAFDGVDVALSEYVILSQSNRPFEMVSGVSVWFPNNADVYEEHGSRYKKLQFNQQTSWFTLFQKLFN